MMSIFTPPTDNLYKFMALSGIVLIAAFIVPLLFFYQAGMEYLQQLRGSRELQAQERLVNERLETLNRRKENRNEELQKLLELVKSAPNPSQG